MLATIKCLLVICVNLLLVFQFTFGCNGRLVQIILFNNSYSNSIVSQQNNFGDGNGGAGGINVNIFNSSVTPDINSTTPVTTPAINKENKHEQIFQNNSQFAQYFGVELVPYVGSANFPLIDYATDDITDMLNVILTKSHSVLTLEMGFTDQENTDGPWNTTVSSQIATVAAQLNSDHGSRLISISQGAGVFSSDGEQPDIEAAFYSAQHSNSISSQTVWGVTLIPNYHGQLTVRNMERSTSWAKVLSQLQNYYSRAHKINLKLGAFIDKCDQIIDGSELKKILTEMAHTSDYIICSIYPTETIANPADYFNAVIKMYQEIERVFHEGTPSLEIILQTGWATQGKSRSNPDYMNSPQKSKEFWDLVEKWAEEQQRRVFMHEAFDISRQSENSSWGFWRWEDGGDYFEEKVNENAVLV